MARNDYTLIGRLLDEGMMGIIVPMVPTEDAQRAAMACRFPPVGDRSWGWGRAWSYGSDYSEWINEQIFVAVQIESAGRGKCGSHHGHARYVDGCWTGPSDLALSWASTRARCTIVRNMRGRWRPSFRPVATRARFRHRRAGA
ncbi:MAG: hypothetical protein R2838_08670 [Caldilineaceae bacterium]